LATKRHDYGFANRTLRLSVEDLVGDIDPSLLQRKGRLILLTTEDTDREALTWLCRDFYQRRSFDVVPTLVESISAVYRDHPELQDQLHLVATVRGLDVHMVGNARAVVRLVRYGVMRDLFDASGPRVGPRVSMVRHETSARLPELYSAQWRLSTGDVLILTVQSVAEKAGEAMIQRVLRMTRSAQAAATALARLARGRRDAPLIVIRYAQLSPVPEMPGGGPVPAPEPDPAPRPHRRSGLSPIWPALLIAVLAIMLSIRLTGADFTDEGLRDYLMLLFFPPTTPTPTATLAQPREETQTQQPSLIYDSPELISPYDGARIEGEQVELVWEWEQALGEEEWFEVSLWRVGDEPEVVELTQTDRYMASGDINGWYDWTVRVVQRGEEDAVVPLSPLASSASFFWRNE
jgi:hypothetical protein